MKQQFHQLLTFVRKVGEANVTLRVVHVSGSVKRCKKFLVTYCGRRVAELTLEMEKMKTKKMAADHQSLLAVKSEILQNLSQLNEACKTDDNSFINQ
jgi:hypothetical protein